MTLRKNVALLAELDTELPRALAAYRREREPDHRSALEARIAKKHSLIRSIEARNKILLEKIRSVARRGEFGSPEAPSQSAFTEFKRLEPLVTGRKTTAPMPKRAGANAAKQGPDAHAVRRPAKPPAERARTTKRQEQPAMTDFGKKLREAVNQSGERRRPRN